MRSLLISTVILDLHSPKSLEVFTLSRLYYAVFILMWKQNFFKINFEKIDSSVQAFTFRNFKKEYSIIAIEKNRGMKLISRFTERTFIEVSSILLKNHILFNYRLPKHCFLDSLNYLIDQ